MRALVAAASMLVLIIDPTQVTAKFENGILCISVPKASRQLPARSTVEIK